MNREQGILINLLISLVTSRIYSRIKQQKKNVRICNSYQNTLPRGMFRGGEEKKKEKNERRKSIEFKLTIWMYIMVNDRDML
jgi:hypothetical protein